MKLKGIISFGSILLASISFASSASETLTSDVKITHVDVQTLEKSAYPGGLKTTIAVEPYFQYCKHVTLNAQSSTYDNLYKEVNEAYWSKNTVRVTYYCDDIKDKAIITNVKFI
ncbi:hypothetical protein [Vibrio marisflavi]|uniref:Uncharacterized protein n=1 Tax=Vibrio marisflavi CECT 7928 TaxID=634439 RepID=A0ABN8DX50_9VIBR|nr:hypothetical protein [Vibrio marisflavi]CAH0535985.1 hypothetical protein VMF7928_00084 [Vibrio marisflavi CECT 7928]